MWNLRYLCWLLISGLLLSGKSIATHELEVLVLDAKDGKPQINVAVRYSCTGPPNNSAPNQSMTNNEGLAKISVSCNDKQKIAISLYPPNKKEQCADDAVMAVKDVIATGFISKPDSAGGIWCPIIVSKTLKPVPGQLIVFVKKPTWWQSHVAG